MAIDRRIRAAEARRVSRVSRWAIATAVGATGLVSILLGRAQAQTSQPADPSPDQSGTGQNAGADQGWSDGGGFVDVNPGYDSGYAPGYDEPSYQQPTYPGLQPPNQPIGNSGGGFGNGGNGGNGGGGVVSGGS